MADSTLPAADATLPVASSDPAPVEDVKSAPLATSTGEEASVEDDASPLDSKVDRDSTEKASETVKAEDAAALPDSNVQNSATTATTPAKSNNRRKSNAADSKGKTLSKKASKPKLTHIDAKPGDYFLVKLKGFPQWPVIICDEEMLPPALLSSRPVSAAKADGSYAEAYADGGKRVNDRSFPVLYLFTNEFGWFANTMLVELTAEKAKDSITDKQRKDLKAAYELAAEQHPLEYYKDMLKQHEEERIALEEAAREAAATPKKSKKSKGKGIDDTEDVEMGDVDSVSKPKSKKRKAEDETSTPQRSDSVKKPKIKLNTSSTPKSTNGTPKAKDASTAKSAKVKKEKDSGDKKAEKAKEAKDAKEAKMTPEERRVRKEKEVLFLRHRLQKGLLTGPPNEAEVKGMSDYLTVLETFPDLEASIIRATKINKVLKAILKLESIPREDEFTFKKRSQTLLDKWNKLLANAAAAAPATNPTNGVNGTTTSSNEKKSANDKQIAKEGKDSDATKPAHETASEVPEGTVTNASAEMDKDTDKADESVAPVETPSTVEPTATA